jgi:hypothetical protein
MVKTTVFLGHEDDVVDVLQAALGVAGDQPPATVESDDQARSRQDRGHRPGRFLSVHLVLVSRDNASRDNRA